MNKLNRLGKQYQGISLVICFGQYAGFYAKRMSLSWRVCFGWIAFTLWFADIEAISTGTIKRIKS